MVQPRHATDDNTIQRMHFTCWKTKAIDMPSEYVIIIALPCHQWLCECTPIIFIHTLFPLLNTIFMQPKRNKRYKYMFG